jgi:nitric oxide reductase large subunit
MKRLWILLIAIFVFSFSILGWIGTEIFRQALPIPKSVVVDTNVLISEHEIENGQAVRLHDCLFRDRYYAQGTTSGEVKKPPEVMADTA